jgi:tRNA pseudouridine38-40 synthase
MAPAYLFAVDAPDTTTRFRLTVHYDGSAFHGWQVQPDRRTVQGAMEASLSRLANRPVTVLGSGRTDTGVHATGQVAAADMPAKWTAPALRTSANALLPDEIWVAAVSRADPEFHPRYDALRRTYHYHVGTRPEAVSPFHRRWCWPLAEELELGRLETAAEAIVGTHEFVGFAKAGQPERGHRCSVMAARWESTEIGVRFAITADRYLHHMVRYLVGTMVEIARGRRPLDDMARLLGSEGDLITSPPAPAQGLFLHRVEYPGDEKERPAPVTPIPNAVSRSETGA